MTDQTHLSDTELADAADPTVGAGTPETAPDVLPAATFGEPVMVGYLAAAAGTVGTLLGFGVPWYGAVALVAFLAALATLTRDRVTPAR